MNSLHTMVQNGKVLYLGISDTPAWLVVKCNDYARFHGLTPFCVYQGHWSCAFRDFERDILPMVEAEGMGLAPWGALGRGQLKPSEEYNDPNREGRRMGPHNEKYARIADKLKALADKKGTIITSIALAYVMHKAPVSRSFLFPFLSQIDHDLETDTNISERLSHCGRTQSRPSSREYRRSRGGVDTRRNRRD